MYACNSIFLTTNRPAEATPSLLTRSGTTKAELGWVPQIALQEMVTKMVVGDLQEAQRHALLLAHGHKLLSASKATLDPCPEAIQ